MADTQTPKTITAENGMVTLATDIAVDPLRDILNLDRPSWLYGQIQIAH